MPAVDPYDTMPGNIRAAWRIASQSADRFRDVISQVLDLDENPGDDQLVYLLMKAHGKLNEPESHRWREYLTEQLARLDDPLPDPESP